MNHVLPQVLTSIHRTDSLDPTRLNIHDGILLELWIAIIVQGCFALASCLTVERVAGRIKDYVLEKWACTTQDRYFEHRLTVENHVLVLERA
jgi:hypothetical protein